MTATPEQKSKRIAVFGVGLIILNYILWGLSLVFGGVAAGLSSRMWLIVATTAFVLSWIAFGAGLALVGRAGINKVRAWFVTIFHRRKGGRA